MSEISSHTPTLTEMVYDHEEDDFLCPNTGKICEDRYKKSSVVISVPVSMVRHQLQRNSQYDTITGYLDTEVQE